MKQHRRDQGAADGTRHPDDQQLTFRGQQIHLPCFGITVHLDQECSPDSPGLGSITSQLKAPGRGTLVRKFNAAIDGLEALILAHACAGVDITSPAYIEGIETAVDAIGNHL
ncbi:MAG: hypothetical protein GX575_29580 [Candidatus Anammoximicrobium sp.]|nr:hypothetical protein [Candidatus Anammoximicrobium sp.]